MGTLGIAVSDLNVQFNITLKALSLLYSSRGSMKGTILCHLCLSQSLFNLLDSFKDESPIINTSLEIKQFGIATSISHFKTVLLSVSGISMIIVSPIYLDDASSEADHNKQGL